jgi:hypothetical protein
MKKLKCEICGNEYDEIMGECWNTINHTKKQDEEQSKTLSQQHSVLRTFQTLAFFLMLVTTGFYIYSLVKFFDLDESYRQDNIIIGTTVSFIIIILSLFCLTKIIDFLFDLAYKIKQ